jgi:transcriptional regulator with XRE-family HTH domain
MVTEASSKPKMRHNNAERRLNAKPARGPPHMSAIIVRLEHRSGSPKLRQFRKKIVSGNSASGDLLYFRSQGPGRPFVTASNSIDGGDVDAKARRHLRVGEVSVVHPIRHRHAQKYAPGANVRQARYASGSMDLDAKNKQDPEMSGKDTTKPKPPPLLRTKLKAWRAYRGKTQAEAAAAADKNTSQISRLESGEIPYDQHYLETLANFYECEPWQLLIQDPVDTAWLYKFFFSLTDDLQDKLMELAEIKKQRDR